MNFYTFVVRDFIFKRGVNLKFIIEFIDYVNIVFLTILAVFVLVLIVFHIYSGAKVKSNQRLAKRITTLLGEGDDGTKKIKKIKKLFTPNGMRVLENLSETIDEDELELLRKVLSTENFTKYFRDNLTFKNKSVALLTTKLIAEFKLDGFMPEILTNIKRWEKDSEAQQVGLLALFLNGKKNAIVELLSHKDFKLAISFRTMQELMECFNGDKASLFKDMIARECDVYVHRACIQCIGNEKIYELAEDVQLFLDSENLNLRISSARALGELEYKPAKEKLLKILPESDWELISAIVEALSKISIEDCYETILPFVYHKEWWVRYRTAKILVTLPENDKLIEDIEKSNDKYANEIVEYMLQRKKLVGSVLKND